MYTWRSFRSLADCWKLSKSHACALLMPDLKVDPEHHLTLDRAEPMGLPQLDLEDPHDYPLPNVGPLATPTVLREIHLTLHRVPNANLQEILERFLLVGASAVVAVLGVVYTCQSSEPAMNVKIRHGQKVTASHWWQVLLDMFTGRYLWQKWQEWQRCQTKEKGEASSRERLGRPGKVS